MRIVMLTLILFCSTPALAEPIGTVFTYQGRLDALDAPVDGSMDLRFELFDLSSGGGTGFSTLYHDDIAVEGGIFAVDLDFGSLPFDGQRRWLEIAVRPGTSTEPYTVLAPRQEITPTPYSLQAMTASGVVGSGSLSTAVDLATAEVSGILDESQIDTNWTAQGLTATTLSTTDTSGSSLHIAGGLRAGSGNVAIIGTDGRIPGISSATFSSLDGSNLTNVSATVSGGQNGSILDDSIINVDIGSTAAISTSKLSGAVTAIASNGLGTLATASSVSGGAGGTLQDDTVESVDLAPLASAGHSIPFVIELSGDETQTSAPRSFTIIDAWLVVTAAISGSNPDELGTVDVAAGPSCVGGTSVVTTSDLGGLSFADGALIRATRINTHPGEITAGTSLQACNRDNTTVAFVFYLLAMPR